MITKDEVTELFCMTDDVCKFFDAMMVKYMLNSTEKYPYYWDGTLSKTKIMLIMILFHDSNYHCFKYFYLEKSRKHMPPWSSASSHYQRD